MKDTTVSARYAKALFLVTEKRGETVRALEDLKAFGEVARPDTRVGHFLSTPQVLLSDKRRVLLSVLEGRSVHSVALFIDLLLRKHRLDQLPTIVPEFEALVERAQGIQRAQVVSAVPLSEAETARLHAELERTTGKKIKLTASLDPSLLGGALVRIGDRVIDRTVQTLLRRMHDQLFEVSV